MSCPYKDIFGKPKTGFHSTRLFGLAVGDTLGTILLGGLFSWIFQFSLFYSIVGMFVFGEILHYWFGVQTAFLTLLNITAC
jgi:hypothetical protein